MRGSTPDTNRAALDQTEAALEGSVTAITPSAARGIIDHWRTACLDADGLELSGVAAGLSDLSDLLAADTLNRRAIADALAMLAESTRASATLAPDENVTPRLERIATNLDRAAKALGM